MPVPSANPLSLPPPKPKPTSYVVLKDFRQGISALIDKTAIPLDATPMCRNVVFRADGGFMVRPGLVPLTTGLLDTVMSAPPAEPIGYWHWSQGGGNIGYRSFHLTVGGDNKVWWGLDDNAGAAGAGTWNDMGIVRSGRITHETVTNLLYISLGRNQNNSTGLGVARFNGATVTTLGTAWSEDIAAPTTGNMPPGKFISWMNDRMWMANIATPDGTAFPNRVHFSHLGLPEAWRSEDYLTVGGPDEITGICALRDMLVVFKPGSTWAVQGYGEDSFRLIQISGEIGCTGRWWKNTDYGVVFWDARLGVCQFNGRGIENLFSPLLPFLVEDAAIATCKDVVVVNGDVYALTSYNGYQADRIGSDPLLWSQADDATWGSYTSQVTRWRDWQGLYGDVVWHLQASAGAGWTSHSMKRPDQVNATCLGARATRYATHDFTRDRLVIGFESATTATKADTPVNFCQTNRASTGLDRFQPPPAVPAFIDAWYLTPWMHAGLPGQIKRFRAPRVVQEADMVGNLLIDVFYDYGESRLRRQLVVPVASADGRSSYSVNKPGTVGRARSVQFRIFNDPGRPRHWGVSQIALPYHPKRMR